MNVNTTCATPSCPICKEPVRDEPTDAKPHPDAVVEHHDCLFANRGARWTLPEPAATLADHVIAALRDAGTKLVHTWRTWETDGVRWAERGSAWSLCHEGPGMVPLEEQMRAADARLRERGYRLTEDVVRAAIASWAPAHAAATAEPISNDHGRTATDEDVKRTWETFWAGTVAPNGVVDLEAVKRELFDYACLLDAVPKVYMHVTGGKVSKPTTLPDVVIAMADDRTTEIAEERAAEVAALAAAWERLYRARDAYHDHSFKAEWDLYEAALSAVRACGGKPPEDTYEEQRSKALASGVELKTEAALEREVEAARVRAAEREKRRPSIDGHTEVAMINVFATPGGKPPTGWPEPGETP